MGLVTTRRPELEDKATVITRIHEAEKYVLLENLYLSPQCGFASCEVGNKLTEEQQWAKISLVREIAEEVWGNNLSFVFLAYFPVLRACCPQRQWLHPTSR